MPFGCLGSREHGVITVMKVSCGCILVGGAMGFFAWLGYGGQAFEGALGSWYVWTAGGVLVFSGLGYLQALSQRHHAARVASLCQAQGYAFTAAPTPEQLARLAGRRLGTSGGFRRVWNLMEGEIEGAAVGVADLEEYDGKRTRQRTVVFFSRRLPGLPNFSLRPRRWGMSAVIRLGRLLAPRLAPEVGSGIAANLDLPVDAADGVDNGDRAFARRYLLMGDLFQPRPNEAALRRVFTPAVQRFFAGHPGWYLDVVDGRLQLWRGEVWCPARRRPELLREAVAVFGCLARQPRPMRT